MLKVTFVGNCQIEVAYSRFRDNFATPYGYSAFYVASYENITDENVALLCTSDLLVEQVFDITQRLSLKGYDIKGRIIRVPVIGTHVFWPFSGAKHPLNKPLPYFPQGPFAGDFGDRFLTRMIRQGISPEHALELYLNQDVAARLDSIMELEFDRWKARENECDISIFPSFIGQYQTSQTFFTPYHPTVSLARALTGEIFGQLGVSSSDIDAFLGSWKTSPFPDVSVPIHPKVAAHLSLSWVSEATTYKYVTGERLTFAEYVMSYMSYTWNDKLLQGLSLARNSHISTEAAIEAVELLRAGIDSGRPSAEGNFWLGNMLHRIGKLDDCIVVLNKAVDLEPSNEAYRRRLLDVTGL